MKRITSAMVLCAAALTGCATVEEDKRVEGVHPTPGMVERPGTKTIDAPKVEPGTVLRAYELTWEPRKPAAVADDLAKVAMLMLDEEAARSLSGAKAAEPFQRVVEREAFGAAGKDVGIEGARRVAEEVLARLAKQGIVDPRLYANAAMQVGYEKVGSGSLKGDVGPGRVNAYRFTYRPRLRGFEMANAGVRLGILPTGELASLRAGGVRPKGTWREGRLVPSGKGGTEQAKTDANSIMRRFYRQVPKGVEPLIAWSRIMYVMPEEQREAVVAPRLVISWTGQRVVDGVRVASRRKTWAYSLVDPRAGPVDFDAPRTKHESPQITRDTQSQ